MVMKSTPQSGSKPAYTEPEYTKNAATIPQKLRNNKGRAPDYQDSGLKNPSSPSASVVRSK